jgi:long-chain acyl-CoA synthetase
MNPYDARPWLKLYPPRVAPDLVADYPDALTVFRAAAARAPEAPAIHYFDTSLSYREIDAQSDALAAALVRRLGA